MNLPRPPRFAALRWPWSATEAAAPSPAGPADPPPALGTAAPTAPAPPAAAATPALSSKAKGDAAEAVALRHLQAQGLHVLARNWRAAGRGGGELDLVMQAGDGTLVFVEVRARRSASHGGAGASITVGKQQRTVRAARHYLQQLLARAPLGQAPPPCRFDVVLVQGEGAAQQVQWLPAAFDAQA